MVIVSNRFAKLDYPFEKAINDLEHLEDPQEKARAIETQIDERIANGLSDEHIQKAIQIIVDGETDSLLPVIDGLLAAGRTDDACEAVLKISPHMEYECYPKDAFKKAIEEWSVDRQLEFVNRTLRQERGGLLVLMLEEKRYANKQAVIEASLGCLADEFDVRLYKKLVRASAETQDIELLKKLLAIDRRESDFLDKFTTKCLHLLPSEKLDSLRSNGGDVDAKTDEMVVRTHLLYNR
jgi:hypothetical protein